MVAGNGKRFKDDSVTGFAPAQQTYSAAQRYSGLGANSGITISSNMKTAISINGELLQQADDTARLMGLSRSRLFALAVDDFLKRQRREQMLLRLNEVYANSGELPEKRLLKGIKSKVRGTVKERW